MPLIGPVRWHVSGGHPLVTQLETTAPPHRVWWVKRVLYLAAISKATIADCVAGGDGHGTIQKGGNAWMLER